MDSSDLIACTSSYQSRTNTLWIWRNYWIYQCFSSSHCMASFCRLTYQLWSFRIGRSSNCPQKQNETNQRSRKYLFIRWWGIHRLKSLRIIQRTDPKPKIQESHDSFKHPAKVHRRQKACCRHHWKNLRVRCGTSYWQGLDSEN